MVAFDREDGRFWKLNCSDVPAYYPGTGDAFASVRAPVVSSSYEIME